MSDLADMLEVMHLAPRFTTFVGTGATVSDRARTMAWMQSRQRRDEQGGMFTTGSGVSHTVSAFGSTTFSVGPDESEPTEARAEVWIDLGSSPTLWRADQGGAVYVATSEELVNWRQGGGQSQPRDVESSRLPNHWDRVFSPATLSGTFQLEAPVLVEAGGRPCWRSQGRRRLLDQEQRFAASMSFTMPGDELEIAVDCATGILLAWTGRHEGETLASLRFDSAEIDGSISEDVFRFEPPDGSVVPSQDDLLRSQLRARGVDPDGMDPSELREELHRTMFGGFASPSNQDPETRARSFTPTGEPPADEDDARIDVGLAFENLDATSHDGDDLINVEHGEGLGSAMSRAAYRYGGDGVQFNVQHIKFLNAEEAMVWFIVDLSLMQLPFEGRARRTEAGWKVSRSTIGELLGRAGVVVPPPD